ncbi:MAG: bidirectional hydrogenase complex protein HoxE [Anaerolineales bacterium]|nr:bidirectional hydrogenase complex protein HoxE [Anaerolineales bacterium]
MPEKCEKSTTDGNGRYKPIDLAMKRYKYDPTALLEVLNSAQQAFGFLSKEILHYVSESMNVPLSQVYGVATFYHMFTFKPKGEHNCIVCTGTACHVKGADQIVQAITETFGIRDGETTSNGRLSFNTARCLGSCGLAPVVVIDGVVHGKQTPELVVSQLKNIVCTPEMEGCSENG